ncbi:laminin subunit alpha-1 [Aplochiton taeniatus]
MFCKLVEHVPGTPIRNPQCRTCDANSANHKERHPITNAIDGTNQWWQSPSIKNGRQFHWVTITLDLRQVFQVAYVIIKAANSPRPGNWILERSLDGVTFDPWQYYAISDSECLTHYNVAPRLGSPTYKRDDEVICTSYYSKLVPLEHGEIHTSLLNSRPSADDVTPELLEFTSARYIRLRLQRIRTLNADLMTLSHRDPKEVDPIVTRRYYYSIKDISVGGMCICYGHAQSCPLDNVTKKFQCKCEHNTCGQSCNECCPGYHQKPWQPGTINLGNTCEKCNCHHKAEDCVYNQTVADLKLSVDTHAVHQGGGVCLGCSQNTTGVNCETCADGFYRPAKVSPYDEQPCVECNCDLQGSMSLACIRDEKHVKPDRGVGVGQCVCKKGFSGERCDRCAFGFRDFPLCSPCECSLEGSHNIDPCNQCVCKDNVMGVHCDLCQPGFFNLQGSNPEGCTHCFCFGVSGVCESSPWPTSQTVHTNGRLLPSSHSSFVYNAPVADDNNLITPGNASSAHAHGQVLSWAASDSFLGNKLLSYGGFLNYSVAYDISIDNQDHSLPSSFQLVMEGNGRILRQAPPRRLFLTPLREQRVAVEMVPGSFVDESTGVHVSRDEMLSVLADVASLRVRTHLNSTAGGAVRLSTVSLDQAEPNTKTNGTLQASAVEHCQCPWGYHGTSCETCLPGFYRVDGILFRGSCLPCECHDHAPQCDITGACLGCNHNTSGPHCDQCLPGYYGDATEGTPADCQRCACPLTADSNNFSPTCVLVDSGSVSCDQCQPGYTGTKCERCASGFYGDPGVAGQVCVLCECNGNVDVKELGHCDSVTGRCLKCTGNTTGDHCQVCQPGYHGDAVTAKNCQACGCHGNSSYSSICDVATGVCRCRDKVLGDKCDRCQEGFHGLQSGQGCTACNCSQSGSLSHSCDEEGRCQCIKGVAGNKCDSCSHGYYNYQDNGCTGECICPPHTEGKKCERCEAEHWGHDLTTGCQPCDCSLSGSSSPQCNLTNGQCPCGLGFSSRSCDRCVVGYRGYPACSACGCEYSGSRAEGCDHELRVCGCEEQHGTCDCKDNVGGAGCEECVTGTFGLSEDNPAGCSPCYCSGVSSQCEERGGMVRVPIILGPSPALLRLVSQSDLRGVMVGVHQQGGEILLDTREVDTHTHGLAGPLYWRLPSQYQGNQLLSYGGRLAYWLAFYAEDGLGLANQEPQVLMRGGTLRRLVIYTDMVAPDNGVRTRHSIPLTEHRWKYFNSVSEKAVSHAHFLSVLSNVEYIIVKASYGKGLQQSRISNITMDTALDAEEGSEVTEVARLIESCQCPAGYAGLSCQECAPGYHHPPLAELNLRGGRLSIWPCVPCHCYNHSNSCHGDTGECLGCQHHTAGAHCNVCAQGYYGKVEGSISDCSMCACPLQENSFSPTCALEGILGDFRCTACQPGYEGRYCERCSVGYHGSPSLPGGVCERCQCSVSGSLHAVCDAVSGQCECQPGVRGQHCDQCEDRHVLEREQCVFCGGECTGVLLDDLAAMERSFLSVNLSGVILAPFSLLVSLENHTQEVKSLMLWEKSPSFHLSRAHDHLSNMTEDLDSLLAQVTRLLTGFQEVGVSTEYTLTQGALLLGNINDTRSNIQSLVEEAGGLNHTKKKEELDSANRTRLMEEVLAMLEMVRVLNLLPGNGSVTKEHRNMGVYEGVQLNVSRLKQTVEDQIEHTNFLLTDAFTVTQGIANITAELEVYREQLSQWRPMLRKHVDSLVMSLKSTDALETVYRAEDHALSLSQEDHALLSSLLEVVNASRNATSVVQANSNIRDDIITAEETADRALHIAATELNTTIKSERSREAVLRSSAVLSQSLALNTTLEGLLVNISSVSHRLGLARDGVCNTTGLLSQPITWLHSLPNGSSVSVQEAGLQAAAAQSSLQGAMERLDQLRAKLEISSSVVQQANSTVSSTNTLVLDSGTAAHEAQEKLGEAESRTERLMERLKPLRILGDNLGRNLSEIREMIDQARRQAASIKVAVQVDRDCVRSYRPEGGSSNFNTLTLTLKTPQPNNLLFYMGSSHTVDYLAVEMHAGKVSLLWDLGSGAGRLDYPAVNINNNEWHRINITRFGVHASLSVHQLEAGSDPLPAVTGTSPGMATVMDVNNSTLIYVGGLGARAQTPRAVKMKDFQGCMGDASLNERNIGLWNYAEREGACRGCFKSPQAEETAFLFDGSGYSVVEKALRATTTSIVILFKTLSPNGLLLYLASNGTRDFLSIELVEGHVRLTFELGSGPLSLRSSRAYNTGVWFKITLTRNKRKGYLSIMAADQSSEKEILEAESPGTASDLNRSDRDPIYIGGLPAARPIRRQVVARSFVGCIKNVEIARTNFDLLRDSYGVKKGCVLKAVRSVSVLKAGGYLQLPAVSLPPHQGELMFSFSSRNHTGLLLSAFTRPGEGRGQRQARQPFLAVMLVSGRLELQLSVAEGGPVHKLLIKPRSGSFADGMEHSVIVTRHRKSVSLQVDENHVDSVRVASSERGVPSLLAVYVGGLPPHEGSRAALRTSASLYGCFRNLALDRRLIDLSGALKYQDVDLDSCLLVERPSRAVLPDDLEVEPTPEPDLPLLAPPTQLSAMTPGSLTCVAEGEPEFLTAAHQFGLSRHSHMMFTISPKTLRKSFSVKLSVRTSALNGLVYYMAHTNQMDYATLQLAGGRLVFTTDLGQGPASSTYPVPLNDGRWHTVKTDFSKKSISLTVDGQSTAPLGIRGNTLDVEGKLYLGGLPQTYQAKRLNITQSLSGCLQSLMVNSGRMDTSSPASQHNTASCFSHAQTGSYFNGSGHAALIREGYKVGSDLSVVLEFRTSLPEAVLLGISSTKVDAIGLEIANGLVVFHVNNGAGRVSVATGGGAWVCDGRWHTLLVKKTKHSLSLTLDGVTTSAPNPHPQSTSAETNDPVYVGGCPVEVKQNCLTVRTAFRGCLRNLRLIKGHVTDALDISSAFSLSGVTPNSCPGPAPAA